MKTKNIIKIVAIALLVLAACLMGYRNVEETKSAAPEVWEAAGFKIVGYEGYQCGPILGGRVWYIVRRLDDNGIIYHGFLGKWGDEYHIYNLSAIDAIKP